MNDGVITFEVMAINETFATVRLLCRIEGIEGSVANQVHCVRVGDTLNVPVKFDEVAQ